MLSKEKADELEIFEICRNSGDIKIGDCFTGINKKCMKYYSKAFLKKPCRCIGKVDDKQRIFVTEDKRCYFTVSDGWGEKNGVLTFVHLDNDMFFENPTGINELRDYIDSIPPAKSWISAMSGFSRRSWANRYLKALEEYEINHECIENGK